MMKEINSTQNQHVKELVALKESKERYRTKRFLIEGFRVITTFIEAGHHVQELLITSTMLTQARQLISDERITLVSDAVMKKISSATTPSGMVAVVALPAEQPADTLTAGLVLAQIQDPGNMGSLIRTAAAMGVHSLVTIEGTDPWGPKVIAASAGTVAQLAIFTWSWQQLKTMAHKKNLKLYGMVVTGGKNPNIVTADNSLIILGNEAHGLPTAWQEQCDELITLSMPGKTESLNVAIAGSIVLYLIRIFPSA
jgi:TrmH family RNA methyltransferase